jgi:hypothetical protein
MTSDQRAAQWKEDKALYERYCRSLEQEHWGEFALVTPDGTVTLAPTLGEAVFAASRHPNPGNHVFKIGDIVVGHIR